MSDVERDAALRERLLRNTVFGIGGRVLGLVVAFLLTPYAVGRLGSESYALYALASTLTGYLALLDLGLGTGYVKYVAEAAARDDDAAVNEVLATGFWSYLAFGALILSLWFALGDLALVALGIEPGLRALAGRAFTLAVLVLSLSGAAAAFRAVLYGFQRIDLATRIGVALILPRLLLTVGVLERGGGVVELVAVDLSLFLLGTVAMAGIARRVFPALSLAPGLATRAAVVRLLRYGSQLQVSRLSEMVNFHFDKLLLTRFVGLSSVTDYDLGSRALSTGRSFPLLLVNAVVPAVSELEARGRSAAIEAIAGRALRYLLLAATPVFGALAIEAPALVRAWLGTPHQGSVLAIRVLALGYLLNVASGAFTSVTQGIARNDYQLRVTLFALVINVVLSSALVSDFGFAGVVTGTGVAMVLAYFYAERRFRALVRSEFGSAGKVPWGAYLGPLAGLLTGSLSAALAHGLWSPLEGQRWQAALALCLGVAAFLGGYIAGVWLSGNFGAADRALLVEALGHFRRSARVKTPSGAEPG